MADNRIGEISLKTGLTPAAIRELFETGFVFKEQKNGPFSWSYDPTFLQTHNRYTNCNVTAPGGGTYYWSLCVRCGSIVGDLNTHDEWHRKNDKPRTTIVNNPPIDSGRNSSGGARGNIS